MGNACAGPKVTNTDLDDELNVSDVKDLEALDNAKQVGKEAFKNGMLKLLNLAIEGYPKAVRSSFAKRNELLRKYEGNMEQCEEDVKNRAAAIKQEAKNWFIGLVPYVGLPASVLWPTWLLLRRVILLAAIYGHDITTEETKAKIIHVFGNLRAVPAIENASEVAIQLVWTAFAGPVAGFLPVGLLVTKVTNVEGHVMAALAKETFTEGGQTIDKEVYMEPLDPEPTKEDYFDLLKENAGYAYIKAWENAENAKNQAVTIAWDEKKRTEILEAAQVKAGAAHEQAKAIARAAAAAAPGAIQDGAQKLAAKGQEVSGQIADQIKAKMNDAKK